MEGGGGRVRRGEVAGGREEKEGGGGRRGEEVSVRVRKETPKTCRSLCGCVDVIPLTSLCVSLSSLSNSQLSLSFLSLWSFSPCSLPVSTYMQDAARSRSLSPLWDVHEQHSDNTLAFAGLC